MKFSIYTLGCQLYLSQLCQIDMNWDMVYNRRGYCESGIHVSLQLPVDNIEQAVHGSRPRGRPTLRPRLTTNGLKTSFIDSCPFTLSLWKGWPKLGLVGAEIMQTERT